MADTRSLDHSSFGVLFSVDAECIFYLNKEYRVPSGDTSNLRVPAYALFTRIGG